MTNEFVLEAINREFPDAVIASSEPFGFLTIEVKKKNLRRLFITLKRVLLDLYFLQTSVEFTILKTKKKN
jgi:NADH-quinone oxidoreductase subunit C